MKLGQKSRQNKILQLLLTSDKPVPGKQMANLVGVTARTIKNDLDQMNHSLKNQGAVIVAEYGAGYKLHIHNESDFKSYLSKHLKEQQETSANYTDSDIRVKELIRFLLTVDVHIKLEDLADSMYVSKSTLQNDLKEAKRLLNVYNITVEIKPYHGIKLVGSEKNFRFAISEFLFAHDPGNSMYMNEQLIPIPDNELAAIRAVVMKHTVAHHIELSDVGLNNLVIHIAIAQQRIILRHHLEISPEEIEDIKVSKNFHVAQQIIKELSAELDIEFPPSETAYVAMHLGSTKMLLSSTVDEALKEDIVNPEVYQYTLEIVNTIADKLGLPISGDQELMKGLYLHLKPALNRIRYGMSVRNPMLESIKTRLPLPFQAGILAGMVLKEKIGCEISDNEIGYIALHIGAAIERSKPSAVPKRCIVVCGSGLGSAQLLYLKLRTQFGSRLEIAETMGYYKLKEADFRGIDFVVSTVPVQFEVPVPVIVVDMLLGSLESKRIDSAITGGHQHELPFLREDLTFLQEEFGSREEVISFLCQQLQEKGLAGGNMYDLVLQREQITSTAYGNLAAVPHPLLPQTDATLWVLCTLRKPIQWEGRLVQFVCLLCIAKDGKTGDLSPMYNLLVKLIDEAPLVQQLVECNNYHSVYNILKLNI